MSRQNFQQIRELCRNQQLYVATKPRHNSRLKEHFCSDKEFLCRDITKEDCEEDCCDTLNSLATMIKANEKELCRDKFFLCRNIKG